MRRFVAIFLLAFILGANSVLAYTVTAPTQTFSVPRLATKQIDISVTSSIAENVTVNIIDSKPWVTLSQNMISLEPGVNKQATLFVSPFITTNIGMYKITLIFESLSSKELKKADVFVSVQSGNIVNIEKIQVTGDLEPLGTAKVSIFVRNQKTTTVNDIEVWANITSATTDAGSIRTSIPKLDPNEEFVIDKIISFGRLALPESYEITANAKYQNELITLKQTFLLASKPVIQVQRETNPLLFGAERTITVINQGNKAGDETVNEPVSGFDRIFFYGDQPSLRAEGVYSWVMKDMAPGETRVIKYGTDYTSFFLILFAIIVAGWVYIKKMRTVRIKKYIMQRKKIEEGEEFTVAVEIKNSTGKETDAEVLDFVPAVFKVEDAEGVKPIKKKGMAGAELKWHVKALKKNEERVFIYKIIPIFGIHGTINLPRASVIFSLYGRKFESRSMAHSIGLPPETADERFKKFFKKD